MEPIKRVRIKNIRGAYGTFDPETNQIDISSKLTNYNIPSRGFVKQHELYHQWISTNNIKVPPGREELLCDVYALVKCKPKELSYMEHQLQKLIKKKYGKNISEETVLKIKLGKL